MKTAKLGDRFGSWRIWNRFLAAGIISVAAATAVVPAPAAEASAGRCPRGEGVTVVVDYGPLGGTSIACNPGGAGEAAWDVVEDAGFQLDDLNSPRGFVCRIEGRPNSSQESCQNTPPPDAYWALFWSEGSPATWQYSSEGARTLDVPEGGSIGWRFQDGGARDLPGPAPTSKAPASDPKPSHPPKSDPTRPPSPDPEPTHVAGQGDDEEHGPASPSPSEKSSSGAPTPKERERNSDRPDKTPRGEPTSEAPQPTTDPAPEETTEALAPLADVGSDPGTGGSSGWLWVVAAAAMTLLAGAAGVVAWRRRT